MVLTLKMIRNNNAVVTLSRIKYLIVHCTWKVLFSKTSQSC